MARGKTGGRCQYNGIDIRSNVIVLSQEFCKRYVRENKFVTPEWDDTEGILKLTFYPSDSNVSFRIPLTEYSTTNTRIHSAKFFKQLRRFKMGRYTVSDIDLSPSGIVTFIFKLKEK